MKTSASQLLSARYDLPSLARLETTWHAPWLIVQVAQHGPRHLERGSAMDDSHTVGGCRGCFWMICADGVGSQPFSRFGARIACRAAEHAIGTAINDGHLPSEQMLLHAFTAAREAVCAEAATNGHKPSQYASTLVAALINGNTIHAAVIGDSGVAAVSRHQNGEGEQQLILTSLCSARQSRQAGATCALVQPDWRQATATNTSSSPHLTTIIVGTDGANTFHLAPEGNDGHRFNPAWPALLEERLNVLGPLNFIALFAYFLKEQPPENRDDRTLLIAFRPPAHLAPSFPVP